MLGGDNIEARAIGSDDITNSYNNFTVSVYTYDDRIIGGMIKNSITGSRIGFHGLMSLIEAIQSELDEFNAPDLTMALRHWNANANADKFWSAERNTPDSYLIAKPLARFIIHIRFRQNASWQGSVTWLDQRQSMTFRSLLELVQLLDGALTYTTIQSQCSPVKGPSHKWNSRESVS